MKVATPPQVEVGNDHVEEEEEAEAPQLGRGRRMRTPINLYHMDFSNNRYDYPDEAYVMHSCYHVARYGAKRELNVGFINVATQLDNLPDRWNPMLKG